MQTIKRSDIMKEVLARCPDIIDAYEQWGWVGDGVTDNYPMWVAMVAEVNMMGGARIVFSPGHYKIDRYMTENPDTLPPTLINPNVHFEGCNGLEISGYGALIEMKGDFHRVGDRQVQDFIYSSKVGITPFHCVRCKNVVIEGFEIDGNVDLMTRDPAVVESFNYGVVISDNTDRVTLRDLYIHHMHTDGIALGGEPGDNNLTCHDIVVINCVVGYVARSAFSVFQARRWTIINCDFSHTGRQAGTYGSHSPGCGCDIEPGAILPELCGEGTFINCHFSDNSGRQFLCHKDNIEKITLIACTIDATTSPETFQFVLSVKDGFIYGGEFKLGNGAFYPIWVTDGGSDPARVKTVMRDARIESTFRGIVADTNENYDVLIENCDIICTSTEPMEEFQPYIQAPNLRFIGNRLYRPSVSAIFDEDNNTRDNAVLLNCKLCSGNRYFTDLASGGETYFATNYSMTPLVADERYDSGTAWRNLTQPTWDNLNPYGNHQMFRTPFQGDSSAADVTALRDDFNALLQKLRNGHIVSQV